MKKLVDSGLIEDFAHIAIMSPFKEQVRRIRKELRSSQYNLSRVNVGALEFYQGSEYKFVVICTTRTRERFLQQDVMKGLGMMYEAKRFCVATTRAKQGLVVIGNPALLAKDPCWLAFLSFCHRHGLVVDDEMENGSSATVKPNNGTNSPRSRTISSSSGSSTIGTPSPFVRDIKENLNATTAGVTASNQVLPANSWAPPQDEIDTPQYLSRLEQGLIFKHRFASMSHSDALNGPGSRSASLENSNGGYIPKALNAGFDDDDPMWTAGIAAEEALRGEDDMMF